MCVCVCVLCARDLGGVGDAGRIYLRFTIRNKQCKGYWKTERRRFQCIHRGEYEGNSKANKPIASPPMDRYNILDIAGINSWILYREVQRSSLPRRDYLLQLAEDLRGEQVISRRAIMTNSDQPHQQASSEQGKRRQCHITKHKNRTADICSHCPNLLCGSCVGTVIITVIRKNCTA